MTTTIVVPTDFSEVANRALPFAVSVARRTDADLMLFHAVPNATPLQGDHSTVLSTYEKCLVEQAEVELQGLQQSLECTELVVKTGLAIDQPPAPAIVQCTERENAGMVVMSSHGRRGPARVLLGSVTEEVTRSSSAPVMVIPSEALLWREGQPLLVAVDFSPTSVHVVNAAARMAELTGLKVCLAHVVEPSLAPYLVAFPELVELQKPSREDLVAAALKRLEDLGSQVGLTGNFQSSVKLGGATASIARLAEDLSAAAVVIGSHGRRGVKRVVLGSVAEGVVRRATRPTMIVKNNRFLTGYEPTGGSPEPAV